LTPTARTIQTAVRFCFMGLVIATSAALALGAAFAVGALAGALTR
jgi:hypothetical protein